MYKKKELLIDLTPLLDVILIILFLVLIMSGEKAQQRAKQDRETFRQKVAVLEEEVTEKNLQIEGLEADRDKLALSLDSQKKQTGMTDDEARAVASLLEETSIFILRIPAHYPEDKIELTINKNDTLVKPEDQDLYNWLLAKVRPVEKKVNLFILKYPGDKILWRDYNMVKGAIKRLDNESAEFLYREENIQTKVN